MQSNSRNIIMLKLIVRLDMNAKINKIYNGVIILLLICLASTQTFPCLDVPNIDMNINLAMANISSVSPLIISGSVKYQWTNPNFN